MTCSLDINNNNYNNNSDNNNLYKLSTLFTCFLCIIIYDNNDYLLNVIQMHFDY